MFYNGRKNIYDSIFANSIICSYDVFHFNKNNVSKSLLNREGSKYVVEPEDFDDDLYTGDYSITSLLKNYSIISLGKNNYDSKSPFARASYNKGNVGIFHIAGPFLVNGDLSLTSDTSPVFTGRYNEIENAIRIDKESNLVTESYVKGNISPFTSKYWSLVGNSPIIGSKNALYLSNTDNNVESSGDMLWQIISFSKKSKKIGDYFEAFLPDEQFINMDRLYDNVKSEQKSIPNGQSVTGENGVLHIKTGSNYYIENINEIKEIIFDDYDNNLNKATLITIKDNKIDSMPVLKTDKNELITTNDYYQKEAATYEYEYNTFLADTYHGNIIWNVPNATYIKLVKNAPFAGHLIAPEADVVAPEMHFAGCFIVNSLYCEGNTEAHFYPLTAVEIDEVYIDENGNVQSSTRSIDTVLGDDYSIVNDVVIGDYEEYLRDKNSKGNNILHNILVNPATYRNTGIIIAFVIIIFSFRFINRKDVIKKVFVRKK